VAPRTSWVLLLGLASCTQTRQPSKGDWIPTTAPDLGSVVARVGGVPIFAKQVLAEATRTGGPPRQALAKLLDDNTSAEAARSAGGPMPTEDDPDVKSALVQRLLERELEPGLDQAAIPDSTLRPLYERARDSFVRPRLIEIGVLAVYTGGAMKDQARASREETARELASFLARHPIKSLEEFAALARDSDWSGRAVTYHRLLQGPDKPFSKAVGREVAKLHAPGDTTALLSDETGYFIARYIDEKPPENTTFEQARPTIVAAYLERWRQEQFLAFSGNLLQKHAVQVYFDHITPDEERR
jgi:hypothetical protein